MDHRITHTCGHEQTHFIAGFASQQERKATWLRTTVCGACYLWRAVTNQANGAPAIC